MERLTDKKEADAQRREYEIRLKQGYPRNIPEERFLRLAAYEDTGLEPEEVLPKEYAGEIMRSMILSKEYQKLGPIDRLCELAQADREKRIIVVPKDNNELFEKLKDLFFSDWAALRREQDG